MNNPFDVTDKNFNAETFARGCITLLGPGAEEMFSDVLPKKAGKWWTDMNKVKMKRFEYDAVQAQKDFVGVTLNSILRSRFASDCRFSDNFTPINGMNENQIAAAYLGADHCEIEPEYQILDNVMAATAWAEKQKIEFQSQNGTWYEFTDEHPPIMFQDESRPFRRQKP